MSPSRRSIYQWTTSDTVVLPRELKLEVEVHEQILPAMDAELLEIILRFFWVTRASPLARADSAGQDAKTEFVPTCTVPFQGRSGEFGASECAHCLLSARLHLQAIAVQRRSSMNKVLG
eukprot:6032539-Amphidinium_carterae.1